MVKGLRVIDDLSVLTSPAIGNLLLLLVLLLLVLLVLLLLLLLSWLALAIFRDAHRCLLG